MTVSVSHRTRLIRDEARRLGFEQVGFAKAGFLEDEARRLENWLHEGRHGTMAWMENHFDMRVDPTLLVPGAKTVISLARQYFPGHETHTDQDLRISKYALGDDYHDVIRDKLRELFHFIEATVGAVEGRVFTDSAPVMDKAWAGKSGIGWMGKNGNMINRGLGSFFFLGEIILDVEFEYDNPATDHCGSCTRCLDACPTQAIIAPKVVDANRCISYLTIELREAIPDQYHEAMGNWMYGCDVCQDVCPWNRKAPLSQEPRFAPRKEILEMTLEGWESMDVELYRRLFKGSAAKRTKFDGLKRNIEIGATNASVRI